MKSISDFVRGKLYRLSIADGLSIDTAGGAHPQFGPFECGISSPRGRIKFFRSGLQLEDGSEIAYASIEGVVSDHGSGTTDVAIEIHLEGGLVKRIRSSPGGGDVVYATLRWIGHTRLRKKIAD